MLDDGAIIKAFDPIGEKNFKKLYPNEIKYGNTIEVTLKDTELCIILTEWDCIKNCNLNVFVNNMKNAIVIDGRNCYSLNNIPKGMIYESIGRKIINNKI